MGDGRKLSHEACEIYRFMAIKLFQKGVDVPTIAVSCGVGNQAVYKWIQIAKNHGVQKLKSTKAVGPEPEINKQQYEDLKDILRIPATGLGYSTDLWSGPRVRHLIKNKFGVNYHQKHMPRLLRRLGLTIKFPERRAIEQDPVALKKWKKYRLPKIIKTSEKTRSLLFYADESLICPVSNVE